MPETEQTYKYTKQSFTQSVKAKYPYYKDVDDEKLFTALTNKYPIYIEQINPESINPQSGVVRKVTEGARNAF